MSLSLTGATRLFPIIGDPIVYARSPEMLSAGFARRGRHAVCIPMAVAGPDLDPVMKALTVTRNVDGLLVTMPHKFTVFAYCQTVSKTSELLGGVSVMRRNPDGSWHGDTQDGLSFVKAQIDAGAQPKGARVLLLGAGAAGSAIAIALLEAGVGELIISDAVAARADRLVALIEGLAPGRVRSGPADPTGCSMVCNATPMGMAEGDPLPLDPRDLQPSMFVGDVIAGHGLTPLLRAAQAAGCRTANGDQMVEAVQEMMLDYMLAGTSLPD